MMGNLRSGLDEFVAEWQGRDRGGVQVDQTNY